MAEAARELAGADGRVEAVALVGDAALLAPEAATSEQMSADARRAGRRPGRV